MRRAAMLNSENFLCSLSQKTKFLILLLISHKCVDWWPYTYHTATRSPSASTGQRLRTCYSTRNSFVPMRWHRTMTCIVKLVLYVMQCAAKPYLAFIIHFVLRGLTPTVVLPSSCFHLDPSPFIWLPLTPDCHSFSCSQISSTTFDKWKASY